MVVRPAIKFSTKNGKMKGFRLEILFSYSGDDGTQCLGWYHGVVQEVVNSKTNCVRVRWDNECLSEHNMRITDQKLAMGNWNPKSIKTGGRWREYITKK